MRGFDRRRDGLFSYVRPENRIPRTHPLRVIRTLADQALSALDEQFAGLHTESGRPSIPTGQRLRALLLLQAFYTIRSERQLTEQLNYKVLSQTLPAGRQWLRLTGHGFSGSAGDDRVQGQSF
jgi:transposase